MTKKFDEIKRLKELLNEQENEVAQLQKELRNSRNFAATLCHQLDSVRVILKTNFVEG